MKYLCLIYADRDEPHEALAGESPTFADDLEAAGEYFGAEQRECLSTLTSPRARKSMSDGPFIETKE